MYIDEDESVGVGVCVCVPVQHSFLNSHLRLHIQARTHNVPVYQFIYIYNMFVNAFHLFSFLIMHEQKKPPPTIGEKKREK